MHPELVQWNILSLLWTASRVSTVPDAVGPSGRGGGPNKGVLSWTSPERGREVPGRLTDRSRPLGVDSHGLPRYSPRRRAPCSSPTSSAFARNVLVPPLLGPKGEPVYQLGHQGATPLLMAAQKGHCTVVQQLVTAGPLGWQTSPLQEVERDHSACQDLH